MKYPRSLFFPAPVEEAGPLKTGLLASNPEHGGDPNHQGHQVLHEEQNQVWTAHLSDLEREKGTKDCLGTHLNRPSLPGARANTVGIPLFPGSPEHDREPSPGSHKRLHCWEVLAFICISALLSRALNNRETFSSLQIGKSRSFDGINLYRTRCCGCSWEKRQWKLHGWSALILRSLEEFPVSLPREFKALARSKCLVLINPAEVLSSGSSAELGNAHKDLFFQTFLYPKGLFGKEDKDSGQVRRVAAKETPRSFLELITQLQN